MKKVWVWAGVLAVVLSSTGAAFAETSEEAKAYFKNGVELLTESPPNYQDAYYQFKLAYEKSGQNWKVLGNLGFCAFKLERDAEAVEYYSEYLEKGEGELSEEEMKQIRRDLLLIRGSMAQVVLTSDIPEVELSVRRTGSSAPVQVYRMTGGKLSLSLRAGTQKITAQHEGRQQVWEVPLSPGQEKSYAFTFAEEEEVATAPVKSKNTPDSTADDAPPASSRGKMSTLRIAGIVTAGVGVGALIGGGVFGLSSSKKEGDARDQADDPDVCLADGGDNVCTPDAEDAFDKAKTDALLANILFIGGGVLTAAGVTMVVLGGNKSGENPSATLELGPAITPLGGGLRAFGTF